MDNYVIPELRLLTCPTNRANQKIEESEQAEEAYIEFKNVSLKYRADLPAAISNFNLKIKRGTKVGIVGRTGSGKSSIICGLMRLYEIERGGSISVNGQDISGMDLRKLRNYMALIPQKPFLFQGSILDNLDVDGKFEEQEIWKALEAVHLAGLIDKFPQGLHTLCLDSDSLLSSGQTQLLCLARAILQKKEILILDEATAHLDLATEQCMRDIIDSHFHSKTVIEITHRESRLNAQDIVIRLEPPALTETY